MKDIALQPAVLAAIRMALAEDEARRDVTSLSLISSATCVTAAIVAQCNCIMAGGAVAEAVFREIDPKLTVEILVKDGQKASVGMELLHISGKAISILAAERTVLNFLQRMCGIASFTHSCVAAVEGTDCRILDTRKTVPGLRLLDKYSVVCGGGENHRMGMHDRVLIKDTHRRLWHGGDPTRLDEAIRAARERFPDIAVEIEVENFEELHSALAAEPEWIMLDNMTVEQMREAVAIVNGRSLVEASGGITPDNLREVAETGVDAISLGCLTHSVVAANLSLEITD